VPHSDGTDTGTMDAPTADYVCVRVDSLAFRAVNLPSESLRNGRDLSRRKGGAALTVNANRSASPSQ
jgi:hypothetical protein